MLFSIITITYNASATVGRTLQSVAEQTCVDYEHLIVDGASRDGTDAIVDAAPGAERRRMLSEPDDGIYDAMNKGICLSRGQYLIFLNAGDKFHSPGTLQQIADAIATGEQPDVVYGQTILVDNEGRYVAPRHLTAPADLTYRDFARGMLVCHQAFVARRDRVPMYNTTYRYSADYDWCIRCLQQSRLNRFIDDVLIDYLDEGVTTANRKASLRERFSIMAYYYGMLPTLWRHIGFIFRFLHHRREVGKSVKRNATL